MRNYEHGREENASVIWLFLERSLRIFVYNLGSTPEIRVQGSTRVSWRDPIAWTCTEGLDSWHSKRYPNQPSNSPYILLMSECGLLLMSSSPYDVSWAQLTTIFGMKLFLKDTCRQTQLENPENRDVHGLGPALAATNLSALRPE